MVNHYTTWTGRYFSNLLMATNPYTLTSNEHFYPPMLFSIFAFFIGSLFFVLQTLTSYFSNQAPKWAWICTVVLTALFFHKMPRTSDSLYWFAGASSHLFPFSLALICIGLYFKNLNSHGLQKSVAIRFFSIALIGIFSFLISGSNETLAIQWLFTLLFVVFYKKIIQDRWDSSLFLPLGFAIVGFVILYFAPGNAVRAKELKGGHDILLLLLKPWGLIVETTVRYLSVSLFAAILFFYPVFKRLNSLVPDFLKKKTSLMLLVLFGLGLFALTFVPSVWTMGGLPPRRVLNNTYLQFLLYGTFLLVLYADKLVFLDRWSRNFSARQIKSVFAIGLLFFFNNFYAWKDLFNLPTFLESMKKRELLVQSGTKADVIVEPLSYFPSTFFYEDITAKTDDYRNVVFSEFYNLKSVRLSKSYPEDQ